MKANDYPKAQGLYDPANEHEACGIGMIANINGKKSHDIVQNAITILCNLEHRGGQSADISTGDGAGILTQIPHSFFKQACEKLDIELPPKGNYGIGMVFLPQKPEERKKSEQIVEKIINEEGLTFLGWRTVPVNDSFVGDHAKKSKPFIRQLFIAPKTDPNDRMEFERLLYIVRKRSEKETGNIEGTFYICSLSSTTIVYKGMLIPEQLDSFYIDLNHPDFKSALALVHSRFSTNTFPSWERSHPNRLTIHNGEFNTLRGNVNWMRAREKFCHSIAFNKTKLEKILPVIDTNGSDSSMFDNCFEFLHLSGRSLAHTAMMMIPEPWVNDERMSPEKRSFYEYHSCLMEPWDGPAAVVYTDGKQIGACLDRNGLRPARYYVTKDGMIVFGSEVGVLDIYPEEIEYKERLHPGKMLLVDVEEGKIISDEELKHTIALEEPYEKWVDEHMVNLEDLSEVNTEESFTAEELITLQQAFGYTTEELNKILKPMVTDKKDPVGSMGYDSPLAVLSRRPQLLYNYFKQLFAQVTNPPLDAIREKVITAVETTIGPEGNLVQPQPASCKKIRLEKPILTSSQLEKLRLNAYEGFQTKTLSILFNVNKEENELENRLNALFEEAEQAIENGVTLFILSDRGVDADNAAIPALLAVSGLHHHLIRKGLRTKVSILLDSAEPREVHHFAMLIGYGAEAIHPYLAYDSLRQLIKLGDLRHTDEQKAIQTYVEAAVDGVVKILSKMGISTIQSYRGAQIFEAVGIHMDVIDKYFTRTASRLGGIGLDIIEKEVLTRHGKAFRINRGTPTLESGDEFQWRKHGEDHQYNPQTIHLLQQACRNNNYELFKKYSHLLTDSTNHLQSLRGLLTFKRRKPIPIEEVEPVEAIVARFKTGAMSYGSISEEAHEALAIAMNRIGGRSNSGEGGEEETRFTKDPNGDWRRSSIKQVASGRFGANSHYLSNADEIQIKIAQGAKPGEGGHLPGKKVYPWIAEVRRSTPGVALISPPPHHDIYSIEDLAELIHNLKNANPKARVSVKLVSAVGVGTIAAGVAKGRADLVLISGYDGGTGAAPRTSIKHTGLPWEIGLAETHQTLLMNRLRDRIVVETDGKMMTGRDVVVAALLGAEEFGFSTAPLVVLGCVMMRVCHLDTCPVGVATQDPELRRKFTGSPDHVVNFMQFIAQEVREWMAALGFRTINEMIGRTDVLKADEQVLSHWKARGINLDALLYQPDVPEHVSRYSVIEQVHGLDKTLDQQELIPMCKQAIEQKKTVKATVSIRNINRVAGTMLGNEITKRYGRHGLPEDTIHLTCKGSAGQSFGAFIPPGITMRLIGDANDYVGKGLSGGKLIIHPSKKSTFPAEANIIVGNVCFYGAISGEAYLRGIAGERFCVRNSGAEVVVEGIGDHGCEYMTGGKVIVLGDTGKNFAAGMSGGIAYVLDEDSFFHEKCNQEQVLLQRVQDQQEEKDIHMLIKKHVQYTNSTKAQYVLDNWENLLSSFIKVIPKDYLEMQTRLQELEAEGMTKQEAAITAFNESKKAVEEIKEPMELEG